jgi:hypothetical protein
MLLTNIVDNLKPAFTMQRKELLTEKTSVVTVFMRHLRDYSSNKFKM